MASRPEQLYEEDFYAWTRDQAQALRRLAATRPNLALDFPHLIEEVADLGTSQRDAVRSQLRRIIEHCLKLEYSPAREPRAGWHETIIDGAHRDRRQDLTDASGAALPRRLPDFGSRPGGTRRQRSAFTARPRPPTPCRRRAPTASPTCCATTGIPPAATA